MYNPLRYCHYFGIGNQFLQGRVVVRSCCGCIPRLGSSLVLSRALRVTLASREHENLPHSLPLIEQHLMAHGVNARRAQRCSAYSGYFSSLRPTDPCTSRLRQNKNTDLSSRVPPVPPTLRTIEHPLPYVHHKELARDERKNSEADWQWDGG